MRVYPVTILNADDSKSATGDAYFMGQSVSATFCPVCGDNTAAGTLKIQGSNETPIGDPLAYTPSTASFCDITNATSTISSGKGPAIVISTLCYQYIRAVYTSGSGGSTTIKVQMSALGV